MMALVPTLSAVLAVGCGGGAGTGAGTGGGTGGGAGTGKKDGSGGGKEAGAVKKGAMTELESKGWGTLKGKVTLDGKPANLAEMTKNILDQMAKKDKDCCLSDKAPAADKEQQTWRIGKDGGLGNVFVWLAPPKDKFFKVDTGKKTWAEEVVLDQPYCAFEPHAFVLFPGMVDPANPKKLKDSGQKFVIKNSAPINHNTNWKGGPENPGDNKILPAGGKLTVDLVPEPKEVTFKCDIHSWMNAIARVYDHPYATVSKDDGTFEIKNVPAGVPVKVVAWHEAAGYLTSPEGEEITFQDGKDTTKDFKATAK